MLNLFSSISIPDYLRIAAEIAILTFLIYKVFSAIAETKARELAFIFIALMLLYVLSKVFDLVSISVIISKLFVPFLMVLVVYYSPELRRAFSSSGQRGIFRTNQTSSSQLDSVIAACKVLVEKKRGALIVFPRSVDIKSVYETATKLNAEVSMNLILTIFDHDTPLHDGACVIQNGKITYASCFLPLTHQTNVSDSFGTRHRAALGLSEECDAVILIVSEETGAISLAYNANIYYDLEENVVKELLLKLLSGRDVVPQDIKVVSKEKEEEKEDAE